jgi:hypothetical protein
LVKITPEAFKIGTLTAGDWRIFTGHKQSSHEAGGLPDERFEDIGKRARERGTETRIT